MDLQELLSSLNPQQGNSDGNTDHISQQVNGLAMEAAVIAGTAAPNGKGASPAAAAVVGCIVGASKALFGMLDDGASLQEKLLFTLVFAGSCSHLKQDGENECLAIEISPDNISAAVQLYRRIMDRDITPHLVPSLQRFAKMASALN